MCFLLKNFILFFLFLFSPTFIYSVNVNKEKKGKPIMFFCLFVCLFVFSLISAKTGRIDISSTHLARPKCIYCVCVCGGGGGGAVGGGDQYFW